jgi:hypothetical protein
LLIRKLPLEQKEGIDDWENAFYVCDYRIEEVPVEGPYTEVIAPVIDSEVREVFPLRQRKQELEQNYKQRLGANMPDSKHFPDIAEKAYQPVNPEGKEWPAYLALARLDWRNRDAIRRFCSTYGLLGLWKHPLWKDEKPMFAEQKRSTRSKFTKHSGWYDNPVPKAKKENCRHFQYYREPLEVFVRAVRSYQDTFNDIMKFHGAGTKEKKESHALDVKWDMGMVLDGCIPRPIYENGRWIFAWNFRSLLDACYFCLYLNLTEQGSAGYKRCKDEKCKRPFKATTERDEYCCIRCRKKHTVAKVANRQVKDWLRKKLKAEEINKKAWGLAHAETDRLYDVGNPDGLKDKGQLQAKVEAFLQGINDTN